MDPEKQPEFGEKTHSLGEGTPEYDRGRKLSAINDEKGYRIGEAADVYGTVCD